MFTNIEELDIREISRGYLYTPGAGEYTCLQCGAVYGEGEVYPLDGRYLLAEKAMIHHVREEHGGMFDLLLNGESKYLSFTDKQRELLVLFHQGLSDQEVAARLGLSPSTVRHQKYMFREKAKQARMYLAMYDIFTNTRQSDQEKMVPVHKGAKMVDERFMITEEESEKIKKGAFSSLSPLKLRAIPPKEKKKVVVLQTIAQCFEDEKHYTEKEVNEILEAIHEDFVTLRRYLISYGFMDRTKNGSDYWKR